MKTGPGADDRSGIPAGRRLSSLRDPDAAALLSVLRGSDSPPPARLVQRVLARVRSSISLRQILDFGVAGFTFGFLRGLWPRANRSDSRPEAAEDPCDDDGAP